MYGRIIICRRRKTPKRRSVAGERGSYQKCVKVFWNDIRPIDTQTEQSVLVFNRAAEIALLSSLRQIQERL